MRTYTKSQALYDYAVRHTPGASQTGSKAPGRAGPLGAYPMFLESGRGSRVRDVDGNEYLDFVAGLAAVGLGHADGGVCQLVEEALHDGALLSLPTAHEARASERLCALTGWAEQARWVKTGSEATEAAVRIARCATGRYKVMTVESGYHSWHSWFQAVKPQHPGVPSDYEDLVTGIVYGEPVEGIEEELEGDHAYACVILEPAPITGGGDAGWLRELVDAAHRQGTLVVFDEVVWGLRLARAGGTEYFGVEPDLACYGKALGNGVPVAAVVGRRDLMRHASVISGTFGGDRLGLAAALAVLGIHEGADVTGALWRLGRQFQDGVNAMAPHPTCGALRVSCTGYPVHPVLGLVVDPGVYEGGADEAAVMSLFLQELAERGVLWHPAGGNVMWAMDAFQIQTAVGAVCEAASVVESAVVNGHLLRSLRGKPYAQAFARAR